ncbi:stage V sporulation protein AB [Seinonella peptonophila]|uniref:Stage V sporulation protein AB n=1 Tax=Seinonella peptonophila TaxID=112248 RepID=A0A1M4TK31_9BACL|nr:stage V sporulation protein AB [Seinonella peptonophila]SHE44637.1 stage V sporulation protein AB [Seinonella peptonophila]
MFLIHSLIAILLGFAGGIAVGGGFVAFITVLDIIPRLVQLSRSPSALYAYEWAIILGVISFTVWDFFDLALHASPYFLLILGLFMGIFIGLLAAALTEVMNVIPILAKRLGMHMYLAYLLVAMVLGKVCGSLFQWLFFHVG